nr:immunoglobulin heavy chain junction region [Macaca mulatta]
CATWGYGSSYALDYW